MPPVGSELPAFSKQETQILSSGGAQNGALDAATAVLTDDKRRSDDDAAEPLLARFLAAWDRLADTDRRVILADTERRAGTEVGR